MSGSVEIVYMNPNYLTVVQERINSRSFQTKLNLDNPLPKDNKHQDDLSRKAKSRLSKTIGWMLYFATEKRLKVKEYNKKTHLYKTLDYGNDDIITNETKLYQSKKIDWLKGNCNYKLGFLTLTLSAPQFHSDNYVREKMVKQLLDRFMRMKLISQYIWRAEKQQNGNIHYHIIIDGFVWVNYVRSVWNKIQAKEGYIAKYQESQRNKYINGFVCDKSILHKVSYREQFRRYKKGVSEDWSNPNSIDIHAIKNISNIQAYISKYFTKKLNSDSIESEKTSDALKISSRLWGCSRNLAKLKNVWFYLQDVDYNEMCHFHKLFSHKCLDGNFFQTYLVSLKQLAKSGFNSIIAKFKNAVELQVNKKTFQPLLI